LDGTPYLFLEYVVGGSLAEWIRAGRTRDTAVALDIGIQLAWGLTHCHARGIVHRDFKPQNVLMTKDGIAKLTDFGTVKFAALDVSDVPSVSLPEDVRRTVGGQLQGTPPYMPPEQWGAGGTVDHRADLYALGVSLFEMLTDRLPFLPDERTIPAWVAA